MLRAVPLELAESKAFVEKYHRHHGSVHRDKWRVGCADGDKLVGVANVGRPIARHLDDGHTLEVLRLCSTGEKDVCSFLYAKCARIAREMGYSKIIIYILDNEDGTSLRAAGWHKEADTKGHSWDTPSRRRNTKAPICDKQRWAKDLV